MFLTFGRTAAEQGCGGRANFVSRELDHQESLMAAELDISAGPSPYSVETLLGIHHHSTAVLAST